MFPINLLYGTQRHCPYCGGEAVKIAKAPIGLSWCAQNHPWTHGKRHEMKYPKITRTQGNAYIGWLNRLRAALGTVTLEHKDAAILESVSDQVFASHQICLAAVEFINEHPGVCSALPEGHKLAQLLRQYGYLPKESAS